MFSLYMTWHFCLKWMRLRTVRKSLSTGRFHSGERDIASMDTGRRLIGGLNEQPATKPSTTFRRNEFVSI